MKKKKNRWIWILVIAYIAFIFSNSLMSSDLSSSLSTYTARILTAFLQRFGIAPTDFVTFHYYVRKLAHFTEFTGLGLLTAIAIAISPLFHSRTMNFLLFLLAIPFSDEAIQYFVPGRSPAFRDMLIDCSGILFGGLLGYLLYLVIKDCREAIQRRRAKSQE